MGNFKWTRARVKIIGKKGLESVDQSGEWEIPILETLSGIELETRGTKYTLRMNLKQQKDVNPSE